MRSPVVVSSAMVEMWRPWGGAQTGTFAHQVDDVELFAVVQV